MPTLPGSLQARATGRTKNGEGEGGLGDAPGGVSGCSCCINGVSGGEGDAGCLLLCRLDCSALGKVPSMSGSCPAAVSVAAVTAIVAVA